MMCAAMGFYVYGFSAVKQISTPLSMIRIEVIRSSRHQDAVGGVIRYHQKILTNSRSKYRPILCSENLKFTMARMFEAGSNLDGNITLSISKKI